MNAPIKLMSVSLMLFCVMSCAFLKKAQPLAPINMAAVGCVIANVDLPIDQIIAKCNLTDVAITDIEMLIAQTKASNSAAAKKAGAVPCASMAAKDAGVEAGK